MPSESPQDGPYTSYNANEEGTAVPENMSPILDRVSPAYLPYRGAMYHGVAPTELPTVADGEEMPDDAVMAEVYQPPVEDLNPVPVRIVDTAIHEYKQWRAWQAVVAATSACLVANRKEGQSSVRVKNISSSGTNRVWLGPDPNVSSISGFPISGGEDHTFMGEAPVYAVADSTTATLAVLSEFGTAQ